MGDLSTPLGLKLYDRPGPDRGRNKPKKANTQKGIDRADYISVAIGRRSQQNLLIGKLLLKVAVLALGGDYMSTQTVHIWPRSIASQ